MLSPGPMIHKTCPFLCRVKKAESSVSSAPVIRVSVNTVTTQWNEAVDEPRLDTTKHCCTSTCATVPSKWTSGRLKADAVAAVTEVAQNLVGVKRVRRSQESPRLRTLPAAWLWACRIEPPFLPQYLCGLRHLCAVGLLLCRRE